MVSASVINTLRYYPELCIGCEMCSIVCPHGVFAQNGRVAQLVRPEACMECGACQLNCPTGAITVDSGVGCAAAMIRAALTGQREPTCGDSGIVAPCCGGSESSCCSADG
jgi:NAD-dependent dihydropyrimidine dehydrogenase PreA subunit